MQEEVKEGTAALHGGGGDAQKTQTLARRRKAN